MFLGPHSGDTSASDADYTFSSTQPVAWVGYSGVIGDVDGDGRGDLAIGAPAIDTGRPGAVLLFSGASPGSYTDLDADRVLDGSPWPDAFGMELELGDLDGDGRDDLVVGAPYDSGAGWYAGSVTLVFGASLP